MSETAPQGTAAGYEVSAFAADPAANTTFTITTPKLNDNVAAALVSRSSGNIGITNNAGVVTFKFTAS